MEAYRPFYASRPGRFLMVSAVAVMLIAIALPYLPVAALFGFAPLPWPALVAILVITALYVAVSEVTKRLLFRRMQVEARP